MTQAFALRRQAAGQYSEVIGPFKDTKTATTWIVKQGEQIKSFKIVEIQTKVS